MTLTVKKANLVGYSLLLVAVGFLVGLGFLVFNGITASYLSKGLHPSFFGTLFCSVLAGAIFATLTYIGFQFTKFAYFRQTSILEWKLSDLAYDGAYILWSITSASLFTVIGIVWKYSDF
jgi:hypothetical protein